MTGMIFDIQRFCVHDGPGIRTTVFMKGCPLRCRWCHNPEGLSPFPQAQFFEEECIGCGRCGGLRTEEGASQCLTGALKLVGTPYTPEALLEAVLKDRDFYGSQGGVTFSGGLVLSGIHQPHPVATGWGLMATPEGRHKGMPVAVTMTPESGTMKNGATAALKSASVFDPKLLQWNYCVMINYYASVFAGENGCELFKTLLTTYFRRGGVQHQPNIMDARTLKDAQLEPEKYKDLIVRLWGISAHFVDLSKELQDELIARLS